jgi:arginine N-succinyltransferase
MLDAEGFVLDRYYDLFDGGPTVMAPTDEIRTIEESEYARVAEIADGGSHKMLVATGRLKDFRACAANVRKLSKKELGLDKEAAELLEVEVGDKVLTVSRNGTH